MNGFGKLRLLAAALGAFALLAMGTGAASAAEGHPTARPSAVHPNTQWTLGIYTLKNVHTGLCVDDSVGAHLRDNTCNGTAYQQFLITSYVSSSGPWNLTNMSTGFCVDDSVGGLLRDNTCSSSTQNNTYQQFEILAPSGDSGWHLTNVHTGLCVDDSVGAGLRHNTCNSTTYQQFQLL